MAIETLVLVSVAGAFGVAAIALLSAAFFTVEQRTTVIVQRLGKFLREAGPGLHMKIPGIDKLVVKLPEASGSPLAKPSTWSPKSGVPRNRS